MKDNQITDVYRLYLAGKNYNERLSPNYYTTVNENERFAFGNQWEGVESKGLPTPSFNIFKRIINYMVGYLVSTPLAIKYTIKNISSDTQDVNEQQVLKMVEQLNKVVAIHWEENKIDELLKECLHDGTVSGDMASYTYWDEKIKTGQSTGDMEILGDFITERLDGVNIMLGNPNDRRINLRGRPNQPYVLIIGRDLVSKLKEEARANGINDEEINLITSDLDYEETAGERGKIELEDIEEARKATYIYKFYPKDGTIYFTKSTKSAYVRKEVDTKLSIYPIAWQNWDRRKNSYHGQALLTNYIPNQKYVNKQLALAMVHYMRLAIPKVIYDKSRISNWNNLVGGQIAVDGDISNVARYLEGVNMPSGLTVLVEQAMQLTIEALGANDILLGNIVPDNATAQIQVTEQATVPLLNQKSSLYDFVEQMAEIWFEFIKVKYGDIVRTFTSEENGKSETFQFNASLLMDKLVRPRIDVGPSSWWSEKKQLEMLNQLYQAEIIDAVQYLERLPDGYLQDKEKVIEELKAKIGVQNQAQENQFEALAQLYDSLPVDEQTRLQGLGPDKMQEELQNMMALKTQVPIQQTNQQSIGTQPINQINQQTEVR